LFKEKNGMKKLLLFIITGLCLVRTSHAQQLYFPPTTGNTWEQTAPDSLGWCTQHLDSLYNFLDVNNTKAFILLKDGKIVFEKYFDTFTKDSNWYWASAGKTITAFLIGKAQEEQFLSISDSSSRYLGKGWTSCTPQQEGNISVRNQLTMTSGLDDGVPNSNCTDSNCLTYKSNPGTRWAYHNAPYTLLEKVIANATGVSPNVYTTTRLKQATGMNGIWYKSDYDNVYASTPRSMARFGLLAQNNFVWNTDTLLHDTAYVRALTTPSQTINNSYGYLWWLNGQSSFMMPQSQIVFPGWLFPDAPQDVVAALGKNGQIINISKSKGLVWVRMGDAPSQNGSITPLFSNDIWKYLNQIICSPATAIHSPENPSSIQVYPNPATDIIHIQTNEPLLNCRLFDLTGRVVLESTNTLLHTQTLSRGWYHLEITTNSKRVVQKIILQ
jgi:CubicO group peptidase (beta-lactamase class C family)